MAGYGTGVSRPKIGRPRGTTKLTEDQELWVGCWCERFWGRLWRRKQSQIHQEFGQRLALFREQNMPQTRPRRRDGQTAEEQHQAFIDWIETDSVEDYLAAFEIELETIQGRTDYDGDEPQYPGDPKGSQHFIVGVPPKPQGVQVDIRRRARNMVKRRYGVSISDGQVVKLWKRFRAIERELIAARPDP